MGTDDLQVNAQPIVDDGGCDWNWLVTVRHRPDDQSFLVSTAADWQAPKTEGSVSFALSRPGPCLGVGRN